MIINDRNSELFSFNIALIKRITIAVKSTIKKLAWDSNLGLWHGRPVFYPMQCTNKAAMKYNNYSLCLN